MSGGPAQTSPPVPAALQRLVCAQGLFAAAAPVGASLALPGSFFEHSGLQILRDRTRLLPADVAAGSW